MQQWVRRVRVLGGRSVGFSRTPARSQCTSGMKNLNCVESHGWPVPHRDKLKYVDGTAGFMFFISGTQEISGKRLYLVGSIASRGKLTEYMFANSFAYWYRTRLHRSLRRWFAVEATKSPFSMLNFQLIPRFYGYYPLELHIKWWLQDLLAQSEHWSRSQDRGLCITNLQYRRGTSNLPFYAKRATCSKKLPKFGASRSIELTPLVGFTRGELSILFWETIILHTN